MRRSAGNKDTGRRWRTALGEDESEPRRVTAADIERLGRELVGRADEAHDRSQPWSDEP